VSGNRGWDGLLDEVAIYTNVLSPSTIAAHFAAAATPATYGAAILAANPVGYWNFDEPAVTTPDPSTFPMAANSGTLLSDADGTNGWGAVAAQRGPGYSGFAAGDKAVWFDGMIGSFTVNDAPGLHFSGQITLAAWVKPLADNYKHDIIQHGFDGIGQETFLRLSRGYGSSGYGSGNYYEVGTTEGEQNDGWYDSVLVPVPLGDIGNWVFLAGTFDGANWNLYRNGVLVGSIPRYTNPASGDQDNGAIDVTNTWTIGSRALPSAEDGNRFAGSVAEPAIFSTTLAGADILALYQAAKVPPVITQAPQNPGTVFNGSTVSFSVWAEGNPTLTYMWTTNGVPTGVTTTNYSISNIPVGTFTIGVTVANPYGTNSASVTFASVAAPPSIVTPIAPTWRFVGYPFTLSVGAGGSAPLTYYWLLGSTVVQAGPSSTYTAVASLANGGNYSVIVSNLTGMNATSGPVTVTVNPVPAGYPSAVIGSGPIAYWRLGEPIGSTVAHDGIAGNDGTYYLTTLGVPGYSPTDPDTAASFSGVNSYVGNISGTAINFTGHASFTLEAWVNAPAGLSDESSIIAKGISTGGGATTRTEQFSLDVAAGVYRFFTTHNNTVYAASATDGPNGTWQHVVGVYDDVGANMYIYVNGVQEFQNPTPAVGLNNTTSAVSIGSKRSGNDPTYDDTFNGAIDEVAVYSKALDAATVAAHYSSIYGSTTPPFILIQPSPTTNYINLPAQFSVVAGGSVPLSYQWKRNGVDLVDGPTASGSVIAGSATPTLTISGLSPDLSDAGTYSVGVSNVINGVPKGLVSAGAKLTVLAIPTAPVSIAGLVAHLPFDGNLADATGRGNNGVSIHTTTNIAGGGYGSNVVAATFASDGKVGKAFSYATTAANTGGTTSIATDATYATLGVRPDLQFSSNVNFSVAFWIRLPLNYQGGDLPFFATAKGSENNWGIVLAPTYAYGTASTATDASTVSGGWAASIFDSTAPTGGLLLYSGTQGSINDYNWHHLVYVCDRTKGLKVYLDGVLAASKTEAGSTIVGIGSIDTGLFANIGQDPTGFYGETCSGDIDDLGIWRVALAPLDAASIYSAAQGGFSFTGPAPVSSLPPLTITNAAGTIKITWTQGSLYSAGTVTGPYTNVPNAVSPYPVPKPGPATLFYRAQQ
jgi:hypothetical protein